MKLPVLAINFKTYRQATGQNAVRLARVCAKEAAKSRKQVVVGVQAPDIFPVSKAVSIPVFAQHVDGIAYGKNTGHILPEAVRQSGAKGTFLNHAEHKLDHKILKATIKACRKAGLTTIVFAANKKEAAKIAGFNPDFVAVEPPELIGTGISVSSTKPEVISSSVAAVRKVKKVPVLCGAGISKGTDVARAIELGAKGAAVASAITTSKNPGAVVRELIRAM